VSQSPKEFYRDWGGEAIRSAYEEPFEDQNLTERIK
jgi:hypothetical protein